MVQRVKRNYVAILPDESEHPFEIWHAEGNSEELRREIKSALDRLVSNVGITTQRANPTEIEVVVHELVINGIAIERRPRVLHTVMPPLARMTDEEFTAEEAEILKPVPPEFRNTLTMAAYDRGHSAGHEEVINELRALVYILLPPISEFERRIAHEARTNATATS